VGILPRLVADQVTILGASGALGFGLALRLLQAGVAVVVGSRDADRAREPARRLAERVPAGSFDGDANGPAAERSELVLVSVPFRNQSGDRRADKRAVATLIARVPGLRPVDCARLGQARIAESLTALLIRVNARYKTHSGARVIGLPDELWPEK
jgi:predicted dinucleotide-binding enzyme